MKRERKDTRVHLVAELEKLNQYFDKPSPIDLLIQEAKAGEYHDYKNEKYACGKVAVCNYLDQLASQTKERGMAEAHSAISKVSSDVKNGEYDEEADESDKEDLRNILKSEGIFNEKSKELFGL